MEVEDNASKGKVLNVSVGRGTARPFSIKEFLGVADGSVCMSDARDKVKCCPGDKPWILVCLALNPYALLSPNASWSNSPTEKAEKANK